MAGLMLVYVNLCVRSFMDRRGAQGRSRAMATMRGGQLGMGWRAG